MYCYRSSHIVLALVAALGWLELGMSIAHSEDSLVREVMRKGAARESENGFCAHTGWRVEASDADSDRFYDDAARGSSKTFQDTFSDRVPYCAYLLVDNISVAKNGRRCVGAQMWACKVGGACWNSKYKGCKGEDGVYHWGK